MRSWARALLEAEVLGLRRRQVPVLAFQPDDGVLGAMGRNAMDAARRSVIAATAFECARRRLSQPSAGDRLEVLRG